MEAIAHLTKGLELLESCPRRAGAPDEEFGFSDCLGHPLTATKGPAAPEVVDAISGHRNSAERIGDTRPSLLPQSGGSGISIILRVEFDAARELAERAARARQTQNRQGASPAGSSRRWADLLCSRRVLPVPRHARARSSRSTIAMRHRVSRAPSTGAMIRGRAPHVLAALALWFLGYPDQALRDGK